jgi:hypothetical protein
MRTILVTATILTLLPFSALAATKTVTGYSEDHAEAYFSSVQGCEDIVVGVSVVEPEKIIPDAPLAPTQAFVFGTFNNICDIGSSYSFAENVTLDPSEFDQKKLQNATLHLSRNIGGFDVSINLDWSGVDKKQKNKNMVRTKNDGIVIRDTDVVASRAADITGTFTVNGIDYAGNSMITGGLSTIRAHTVQKVK